MSNRPVDGVCYRYPRCAGSRLLALGGHFRGSLPLFALYLFLPDAAVRRAFYRIAFATTHKNHIPQIEYAIPERSGTLCPCPDCRTDSGLHYFVEGAHGTFRRCHPVHVRSLRTGPLLLRPQNAEEGQLRQAGL